LKPSAKLVGFLLRGCGALLVIAIAFPGCASEEAALPEGQDLPEEEPMVLSLSSPAFQEGGEIPAKYACDGQDVSPSLVWDGPPAGTHSWALIMDDPDAPVGIFTHWVLFNIPASSLELPEAVPNQAELSSGALQGKNDFGRIGYGGPCPPSGGPHRYRFTIYALDQSLDLEAGVTKNKLLDTMRGHILAQYQLTGTYQR